MQKNKIKFLLLGSNGQVGLELRKLLICFGDLKAPSREELDILDNNAVRNYIAKFNPQWIINAIAYTNVDLAEKEHKMAYDINADFPKNLAQISNEIGAKLVHLSTDYVFDGKANKPYIETAKTNPINIYGKSKLLGEQNIINYSSKYIILRTSWVYGLWRNNFLLKMINFMKQGKSLNIVYDQIGAPTWSRHIAQGITYIINTINIQESTILEFKDWGVFHLTSEGYTSWYEFTKEIHILSNIKYDKNINKVTSCEFNAFANRPKFSILSNKKVQDIFTFRVPHWKTALKDCLIDLKRY